MSNVPQSSKRISVICRLPSGIELALYDPREIEQRSQLSAQRRPDLSAMRPTKSVVLKGARHDPRFHAKDNHLLGMAGRTEVDAAFWEAWLGQNQHNDLVTKQLIFAEPTPERAERRAREFADEKTGFESLNPDALPVIRVMKESEPA